jgi:hypothetical protein
MAMIHRTYSTVFIPLYLWGFPAAESSLIDEVGKFLFHQLINFIHGLFQPFAGSACDVEI